MKRKVSDRRPLTRPEPTPRTRATFEQRLAVVQALRRLGSGGKPLAQHIAAFADAHGVCAHTVREWLKDPQFAGDDPKPTPRAQFGLGLDHLAVIAQEQNLKDAHARLTDAGLVTCSYRTFARAARERVDPALLASALQGHKGLMNNTVYLRYQAPHRNHTWHFDHTKLDVWVWPSHKHKLPVRPYATVVVDDCCAYMLEVSAWPDPVNTDRVSASLAGAATLRTEHGTEVGGRPDVIVFDNAGEHGEAIRQGCARLGIVPMPTEPYTPTQNGKAERHIGLLNQRLAGKLPGATRRAGTKKNGSPRFVEADPRKVNPAHVLTWDAFLVALEAARNDINTTLQVQRLGGLTRLEAWQADQTALVPLDPAVMRQAMLIAGKSYTINGDGIHFRNRIYVAPEFVRRRGDWLQIRHLPTNLDFIEVFDLDGEHVCTAWDQNLIPASERSSLLRQRTEQTRQARAIDTGVMNHRRQLAAAGNAAWGHENTTHDASTALDNIAAAQADLDDNSHDGDRTVVVAAATRPAQPRSPVSPPRAQQTGVRPEQVDSAVQRLRASKAAKTTPTETATNTTNGDTA